MLVANRIHTECLVILCPQVAVAVVVPRELVEIQLNLAT
jgi:hypothetical protein